ncbi:MAG: hypothetical protein ACM3SY_11070 [Candidatus Omnitrophota bacterium]
MKKIFVLFFSLLIVPSMGMLSNNPDVSIITNPGTDVSVLTKKDIRDIFTGVKKTWDSGGPIIIAVLEDSDVHKKFLKEYVNKTPFQFRNYWREKVFTGEGENPKSFKTEEHLIDFVAGTRGAIGYISTPTNKPVKIVKIVQ